MKSHPSVKKSIFKFLQIKEVMKSQSINLKSQGIENFIALNLSLCLVPRFL